MIFCFVYEMSNRFTVERDWSESKKYFLTFLSGGGLHLLFFLLLQYLARDTKNMLIELFYKFYLVFVLVDVFIMAILYKLYWGRSIVDNTPQIYLPPEEEQNYEYDNYFPFPKEEKEIPQDFEDQINQIREDIYQRAKEDKDAQDSEDIQEDIESQDDNENAQEDTEDVRGDTKDAQEDMNNENAQVDIENTGKVKDVL